MTIDLSTARAGCEVTFRCGGKAVIKAMRRIEIEFDDGSTVWYRHDGCYKPAGELHMFDIVSITAPPLTEAERWRRIAEIAEKTDRLIERVLLDQDHFDFDAWRKRNAEILALAEGRAP